MTGMPLSIIFAIQKLAGRNYLHLNQPVELSITALHADLTDAYDQSRSRIHCVMVFLSVCFVTNLALRLQWSVSLCRTIDIIPAECSNSAVLLFSVEKRERDRASLRGVLNVDGMRLAYAS